MNKIAFVSALIMLEFKKLGEIKKTPTKMFKDGVEVHVYHKNIIVRKQGSTKNIKLALDVTDLIKYIDLGLPDNTKKIEF